MTGHLFDPIPYTRQNRPRAPFRPLEDKYRRIGLRRLPEARRALLAAQQR